MLDEIVPDSFDDIEFGDLADSGIAPEEIQAIVYGTRSQRLPKISWAKAESCFRIELDETVIHVFGSPETALQVITLVVLGKI